MFFDQVACKATRVFGLHVLHEKGDMIVGLCVVRSGKFVVQLREVGEQRFVQIFFYTPAVAAWVATSGSVLLEWKVDWHRRKRSLNKCK